MKKSHKLVEKKVTKSQTLLKNKSEKWQTSEKKSQTSEKKVKKCYKLVKQKVAKSNKQVKEIHQLVKKGNKKSQTTEKKSEKWQTSEKSHKLVKKKWKNVINLSKKVKN